MSGHGLITEWSLHSVRDLRKILRHFEALEELGFNQDEDVIYSIQEEIRSRSRKRI